MSCLDVIANSLRFNSPKYPGWDNQLFYLHAQILLKLSPQVLMCSILKIQFQLFAIISFSLEVL